MVDKPTFIQPSFDLMKVQGEDWDGGVTWVIDLLLIYSWASVYGCNKTHYLQGIRVLEIGFATSSLMVSNPLSLSAPNPILFLREETVTKRCVRGMHCKPSASVWRDHPWILIVIVLIILTGFPSPVNLVHLYLTFLKGLWPQTFYGKSMYKTFISHVFSEC